MNHPAPIESYEKDGDRMVVKVLGRRLGHSEAWSHYMDWTVLAPSFQPEAAFYRACALTAESLEGYKGLALLIDYYNGRMILLHGVHRGAKEGAARAIATYDITDSQFVKIGVN